MLSCAYVESLAVIDGKAPQNAAYGNAGVQVDFAIVGDVRAALSLCFSRIEQNFVPSRQAAHGGVTVQHAFAVLRQHVLILKAAVVDELIASGVR